MFNFYVVLPGCDTAGLPLAGANSKLHNYKQKWQKMKDLPKLRVSTWKPFEDFRRKKRTKTLFSTFQKQPSGKQGPWARQLNKALVKSKLNKNRKKAFSSKLLYLCKTRTKKSSPDMFNCYVVLAGRDMVIDASRSSTCRRKIKAPSLQTKVTKNEGSSEIKGFTKKPLQQFREKK